MAVTTQIDLGPIARELNLRPAQVETVVGLLDAGNTIPFITRYRKDQTGGLDEEDIGRILDRVTKARLLHDRKQTILRSIESQGKLTPELAAAIAAAETSARLEDLYLPFKPKKQTLATAARERGLQLLADEILSAAPSCADLDARAADFVNPDRQVANAADALLGAGHILAELFSERADLRQALRGIVTRSGKLATAAIDPAAEAAKPFRDYFDYREQIGKVPPHRVLAINRGEKHKALRVKLEVDEPAMHQAVDQGVSADDHPHAAFLRGCGRDALERLIFPSLEREVRRDLTDKAEAHAVKVFARNVRNLFLQPPVRDRRVLAVDPGFKSGCKLAALDEFGQLLEHGVIHLVGKEERREQAKTTVADFIERHRLNVVAIGNGTACRETEVLVAELIAGPLEGKGVVYTIVNEAGASVYSTSAVGREELPTIDATIRGAVSIGRRLLDPLSELVKIEPASIGVGLYQHDVKARHLESSLDEVVQSCVNFVGVDVNSASPALLRYVSGLNQLKARQIFEYRVANGPFASRDALKNVPGMGEATFVQAAGFLKIAGGANPLDATWIHPESYPVAEKLLERMGRTPAALAEQPEGAAPLSEQTAGLDVASTAAELQAGTLLLSDMLTQLARPGRDPREDLPLPLFKREILKLEHLEAGMELAGTVLNVVDFGAFVDIGLKDTGLVHISQVANRYVPDPHEVVAVGDIVKVWVMAVDKDRRRVSLTMIAPGSPPRPTGRPSRKPAAQPTDGQPARPPRERGRRPPRKGQKPAPATTGGAGSEIPAAQPPQQGHRRPPASKGPPRPAPKPKAPPKPLTKAMKEGKEPLRTFGDLFQFAKLKADPPPEPPGK
ncbi:MAG: Tex-like N-terminal domain-containing protein [Pirellulales bacterium]